MNATLLLLSSETFIRTATNRLRNLFFYPTN